MVQVWWSLIGFLPFCITKCKHEEEQLREKKNIKLESTYRNLGMLSSFSGMGPEKRLFSMFLFPINTLEVLELRV